MRVNFTMLVRQNLTRKLLRSVLLVACITIAFFVYGVLSSFRAGFEGSEAKTERLVVVAKVGGNESLPLSYVSHLRAVTGVEAVTYMRRLRAFLTTQRNIIGANAVDVESYASVYGDTFRFSDAAMSAFVADRTATLVGQTLAKREGWNVGDKVTLTSFVHANKQEDRNWTFTIAGIFDGAEPTVDTNFLIVRYDYFNTALARGQDRVDLFGIKLLPDGDVDEISTAIDANYINSSAQTRTQTETAFMSAFLEQIADVAMIVRLIVSVAFATILLIVANTMIFAIRERTLEIAILKVLGFSGGQIMLIILSETAVLFAVGLTLGLALTAAAISPLGTALSNLVPDLQLTPQIVASSLALALIFSVLTGLLPAFKALRLPIAAALRHR